jgi:hypothetical protein
LTVFLDGRPKTDNLTWFMYLTQVQAAISLLLLVGAVLGIVWKLIKL